MNISKILGRTITSLALITTPVAKAENKAAGAIFNYSSLSPKISTVMTNFSQGTNKVTVANAGTIFNSTNGLRITNTFESGIPPLNKKLNLSGGSIIQNGDITTGGTTNLTGGTILDISGGIVNAPTNQLPVSPIISADGKMFPMLQVAGSPALADQFTPVKTIPLVVDNITKLKNTTFKVGDTVDLVSELTYGNNQKTNVFVSGLSNINKFFKTKIVDPASLVIGK